MEWKEIDRDCLPDGEVLCANFKKGTYGFGEKILGYVEIERGIIICESSNEVLENCTHYIDINGHDIKDLE